ncbi:MAG TPA: PQQ-dependent sugar dehydrogenase [Longimicrobiales bacterium]|nr:PQQ-dependent sugar dehydrogenase [Longimicrobiales bacterium]
MLAILVVLAVLAGCADGSPGPVPPAGGDSVALGLQTVAEGLISPVYLTTPPGDARLFIVEQPGRIRIVKDGRLLDRPFLDITAKVRSGGEQGLLSVAFDPKYGETGFFYVDYTDRNGDTRVERYRVSADADVADPASVKPILFQAQPFSNHNGGLLVFGPDGMLYVGLGDGGSGGDPQGNGQSLGTLLGKILRIDPGRGDPYAIPADNPFVARAGARPEIWAYGLRNPWRFAFDRTAGLLYIADVGQNKYEEVDAEPAGAAGLDYGWNRMEGLHCYGASTCDQSGLRLPVLEYEHPDGCSITGGYVYRGRAIPEIAGQYFYSDYCGGWLRSFRLQGRTATPRRWDVGNLDGITSFGEDAAGELYVVVQGGTVSRIVKK